MAGIKRTGGVSTGLPPRKVGTPSPKGQWSSLHDLNVVDFDRDEFTRLIEAKGYDVIWEKAALCPNRPEGGISPGAHDINCSACDGTGTIYFGAENTRMLIQSVTLSESFAAYGRWDAGQIRVTGMPEFKMHFWDRLTLCNGIARFHEIVTRTPTLDTNILKYPPHHIEQVAWIDRTGALKTYAENTDFVMSATGIEWIASTGTPDNNTKISIAYTYRPRYVVLDLMHQHRESTVNDRHYEFPVQALAKLDYLVRDESKDENIEVQDKDPFRLR